MTQTDAKKKKRNRKSTDASHEVDKTKAPKTNIQKPTSKKPEQNRNQQGQNNFLYKKKLTTTTTFRLS